MINLKQAQILYFPYQTMYGEDLAGCDGDTVAFHVRLWATRMLNAIHDGRMEPTDENIQKLRNLNESLRDLGKPELPLDFLN